MDLKEKAAHWRAQFEQATRDDGTSYWRGKVEEETRELAHAVHDDMLPDDWRYQFLVEALYALEEHESSEEARDGLEADVLTRDLLAWTGSHGTRIGRVDDVIQPGDLWTSLADILQEAQREEKQEVFDLTVAWLDQWEPVEA